MTRTIAAAVLYALSAAVAYAAEPVQVTVKEETRGVEVAPYMPDSLYPVRAAKELTDPINKAIKARQAAIKKDAATPEAAAEAMAKDAELAKLQEQLRAAQGSVRSTVQHTFPMVTLNNGNVEVKIVPTLGMRVLNAVNLRTGRSMAGTTDPREFEKEQFSDVLGFDAGYIEASYPYFEHGTGVRQSAGHRVIKGDDGSVTVAMNMRFTHHQEPNHMGRYGRYAQHTLSQWVTLKPGEDAFTVTYRLENPTPLRRSKRLWVNHRMEVARYEGEHILYPAGYVMPHGGGSVAAFLAEGGKPSWVGASHFALHPDYGFAGTYDPKRDSNALVIADPKVSPGLKLYTTRGNGGFMEIWVGSNTLFEDPAPMGAPYEPTQFTVTYREIGGYGRVVWANPEIAATVKDGKVYVIPTRKREILALRMDVFKGSGTNGWGNGSGGTASPEKPFAFDLADGAVMTHVKVMEGDKELATFTYPLHHTDTTARHAEVKPLGGKLRLELEENSNHIGAPTARDAVAKAKAWDAAQSNTDTEQVLSWANVAYRYGHLDTAEKIAAAFTGTPEADYLRALIAWEKAGSPKGVDFGKAGLDSYYMRALQAHAAGDDKAALEWLEKLVKERPTVYRPRLLMAYLKKDTAAAKALAGENPASPEAQLVLQLLGDKHSQAAKEALLKNNPDAPEQLAAFEGELTKGAFTHPRRYGPMLPKQADR